MARPAVDGGIGGGPAGRVAAAAANEIAIMIIDVHAHVYADPKIKPHPGSTTFMSAKDQIAVMDRLGVDKAVILPLNNAECPAEPQSIGEVLSICERYPGRFIPFCNVDPRLPRHPDQITVEEFEHQLSQYRALGCKGIGEVTARIRWDDHPMLCMLDAAENLGLEHFTIDMSYSFVYALSMGIAVAQTRQRALTAYQADRGTQQGERI